MRFTTQSPGLIQASFLLVLLLAGLAGQAYANVFHVDRDAPPGGDGTSWKTAFDDLQDALEVAAKGDQVWVAAGTYLPSAPTDPLDPRSATFSLVSGVELYGGFVGNETSLKQRDWDANPTILCGDFNGDDLPGFVSVDENAYHVLEAIELDTAVVIDGFTITAGNANGANVPGELDYTDGGGLRTYRSDAIVRHCVIRANQAVNWGGALSKYGLDDTEIQDCLIEGNVAGYGGGIYSANGDCFLTDCVVVNNNSANDGGGASLSGGFVSGCTFSGNDAASQGGAINAGSTGTIVVDSQFLSNTAREGGALHGGLEAINCQFLGNEADDFGGAVMSYRDASLESCTFSGNSAPFGGAVHHNGSGGITVNGSVFTDNNALGTGGAFNVSNATLDVASSQFVNNWASEGGSIALSEYATATMTDTSFTGGEAAHGGAIAAEDSTLTLTACTLRENDAVYGGALDLVATNITIEGGEFTGNTARNGGALHAIEASNVTLMSSTFACNEVSVGGGGVYLADSSLSIHDNGFVKNFAAGAGGGLAMFRSACVADQCEFTGNHAGIGGFSPGGAILGARGGALEVVDSTFVSNSVNTQLGGPSAIHFQNPPPGLDFLDVRIRRCRFSANQATGLLAEGACSFYVWPQEGGHNLIEIEECLFERNTSELAAGLFIYRIEVSDADLEGSSLIARIDRCVFLSNEVEYSGGALSAWTYQDQPPAPDTSVRVTNCVFNDNRALVGLGGAMYNSFPGLQIENCTFFRNHAQRTGGISGYFPTQTLIRNCILWNNTDDADATDTLSEQYHWPADPLFTFNCVEGLTEPFNGNFGDDPLFVDPDGPDDIPGTEDDDFHVTMGSPCINAGDPDYVAAPGETDFEGDERVQQCRIDVGADETPWFVDLDGSGASDECECPADIAPPQGDGQVTVGDILAIVIALDMPCDEGGGCPEDIAPLGGDGQVTVGDVLAALSAFGPCP